VIRLNGTDTFGAGISNSTKWVRLEPFNYAEVHYTQGGLKFISTEITPTVIEKIERKDCVLLKEDENGKIPKFPIWGLVYRYEEIRREKMVKIIKSAQIGDQIELRFSERGNSTLVAKYAAVLLKMNRFLFTLDSTDALELTIKESGSKKYGLTGLNNKVVTMTILKNWDSCLFINQVLMEGVIVDMFKV